MRLDQLLKQYPNMRLAARHDISHFQSDSFDLEFGIGEWRVIAKRKRNKRKNFRVVGTLRWKR